MAIYRNIILMIGIMFATVGTAAEVLYPFVNHEEEVRYHKLLLEIRCMVCENQSLTESNTPLAEDLRKVVYQKVLAGQSDQEIKSFLVERYGATILYEPPVQANTLFLWLAPFFLMLIGVAIWLWRK